MNNKAVFWDRDGTLIKHHDYLTNIDDVALIRGASGAIKYLKDRGYMAVVVTNQSAVARGMITEKQLSEINRRFSSLLMREGAHIDKLYYCPFHPEATVEEYRQESQLRKPSPGMLLQAAQELELDLSQCWMIGDDDRDILAGQAAGCRTILIQARSTELVRRGNSKPDFVACNPQEAANIVAHYGQQTATDSSVQTNSETELSENLDEPEPVTDNNSLQLKEEISPEVIIPEVETNQNDNNSFSESPADSNDKKDLPLKTEIKKMVPEQKSSVKEPKKKFKTKHQKESNSEPLTVAITETTPERKTVSDNQLLQEILRELKSRSAAEEYTRSDFSAASLLAGIVQMVVLLCLLMAYIATGGLEPEYAKIQAWLSAGLVFQAMTIALLMMK